LAASLISFVLITYLATFCMLKMIECKNRVARDFKSGVTHGVHKTHKVISFGMIARVAYGRVGRWVIDGSILLSQLGFASAGLIFCSKNLQNLIVNLSDCKQDLSRSYIIMILGPLMVPFVWIRQLTRLSLAILISDCLIVLGLLFIFARNLERLAEHGVASPIVNFRPIEFWVFLGAALYALEGTAFVLPINLAMRDKNKSNRIIVVSSVCVGALYMAFGTIGYLAFGDQAQSVITLNLQEEFPNDKSVVALQIGYVMALLLTYPVALFPAVRIIEPKIFKDRKSLTIKWRKNALRVALVGVTVGVAIGGADQFDNFIGLIGGLACVPLSLVYPSLFHLRLFWDDLTPRQRWANIGICAFGVFGSLATTVSSAYSWATESPVPDSSKC